MKIVAIGGSLRPLSCTYKILELSLIKLKNAGVEVELIDLRKLTLPFCQGYVEYSDYPDVDILRNAIRHADGIIMASPEYHGSMSGVLKNALDLIQEEDIQGKVVALIAILGGVHSSNALNTMRVVCRQLRCWVLPEQLMIPFSDVIFNKNGHLDDKTTEDRLDQLLSYLIEALKVLKLK